jgi:hypothetical protein
MSLAPLTAGALDLELQLFSDGSFLAPLSMDFDSMGPAPLVSGLGALPCGASGVGATGACGTAGAGFLSLIGSALSDPDDEPTASAAAGGGFTDTVTFACNGGPCPAGAMATMRAEMTGELSDSIVEPWDTGAVSAQAQVQLSARNGSHFDEEVIICRSIDVPECFDVPSNGSGDNNQPISAIVEITLPASGVLSSAEFSVFGSATGSATPLWVCPEPGGCPPLPRGPVETLDQWIFSVVEIHWLGIEMRDSQGEPIDGVTAPGTTGVDYAQPVPEPDVLWLDLAALAALALVWPRRAVTS